MTDKETSSFLESDSPKTNILDHIVHLCPPAALEDSSQRFRDLGFNVLPGGTHADGLTYNALIVLESGIYIELISFTHPVEYYPAGSQERRSREAHRWARKNPGWIDFAFLGNGSKTRRISDIVNARAQKDGLGQIYATETEGGRLRPDGIELKWLITSPIQQSPLPFFCGDVTSRDLRVPTKPSSNTEHPSSALDIYEIEVLTTREDFSTLSAQLSSTLGNSTVEAVDSAYFALDSPGKAPGRARRLVLRIRDETTTFGENAVVAVTFLAAKTDRERDTTPYGKLQWRQA